MSPHTWLAAGLLAATVAAAPAHASPCTDQIAPLEARMKDQAKASISASTGGQANASARGGEGGAAGGKPETPPTAPVEKSAEAGKGGDTAIQAKVALDEARTADAKGDAKGCLDAVGRAKRQLDAAP